MLIGAINYQNRMLPKPVWPAHAIACPQERRLLDRHGIRVIETPIAK